MGDMKTPGCIFWLCLALLCLSVVATAQEYETAVVVRVKDGDTFVARIGERKETVRLIGVDAPESYFNGKVRYDAEESGELQAELVVKGRAASAFLKTLLPEGTAVRLEYDKRRRDKYDRLLCYVYIADGTMVNELLVREGHAIAKRYPPNVRYHERLRAVEDSKRN